MCHDNWGMGLGAWRWFLNFMCASFTDVRLVGMTGSTVGSRSGRVQLRVTDTLWSNICPSSTWSFVNALVVCRELGFGPPSYSGVVDSNHAGTKLDFTIIGNVACRGAEQTLKNCNYTKDSTCKNTEVVMVTCRGKLLDKIIFMLGKMKWVTWSRVAGVELRSQAGGQT